MVMHCACNLRESECGYPKCHNGEKDMNEELASLRQQLAECQTMRGASVLVPQAELEAMKKDAERMLDALTFIKNEVSLTSSQYEVIRQAMRGWSDAAVGRD